jgi:hypothetical protein
MGLQVNSLLFRDLPIILDSPCGAVSAASAMEEQSATFAFVSPETPDVALRPNLSPFARIQMTGRIDRRDDFVTSVVAALREFWTPRQMKRNDLKHALSSWSPRL